jgi:SAM-dependent methyltransferase
MQQEFDARRQSPAAERNKGPILAQLSRLLPARARVLEIASGTGQHAAHFAASAPGWEWQPTDADPGALPSIAAWCAGLANVAAPVLLDVMAADWPVTGRFDAVVCANMLHISPWPTCAALVRGAARAAPEGLLVVYGPFVVDGEPTAPSNLAFDADLRGRDPSWGLRRLADVCAEAAGEGWSLRERIGMPANNLVLVFGRGGQPVPGRA